MESQSDILASIKANLQQAVEKNKSREQTVKFELNGQIRACCLSKPFTYSDLLKSIETLFGNEVLATIDMILCSFSRDDAFRLSITNDDDLNKIIAIAEVNRTNRLKFLIICKTNTSRAPVLVQATPHNPNAMQDNNPPNELDDRSDSPPPGTIAPQKRHTTKHTTHRTPKSTDGGTFIPESSDEVYSSNSSSIASRESSSSENCTRRRLGSNYSIKRILPTSGGSGGSAITSSSNSSHTSSSSSESLCTQCSCSGHHYRSPQTPSNWKLGRQIGHGAFGKVFLCYDVDNGCELAIKQIPIRGLSSETSREVKILECEMNVFKQLNHERIVRYHGAVKTDEYLQIFMEYMPGGSVREQIINYGELTEQLTRKYTRQILEGLIYLHENRFIHRDIKCANILRDIAGNIKLADFGTSRRLIAISNQNQPDSGTIGTAHWTAPEIIHGSIVGRKADIWSLGCTIVEMLTKGPPWHNLPPIAAIFRIATSEKPQYQLPDNVSTLAREFIDACLTKDYHQRPTAQQLIKHTFLSDIYNHSHSHQQNCSQTSTTFT